MTAYDDRQRRQQLNVIRVTLDTAGKVALHDWCETQETTISDLVRHLLTQATGIEFVMYRAQREKGNDDDKGEVALHHPGCSGQ